MRYLAGFLVTIGLIVLIVVLLTSGGSPSTQSDKAQLLQQYASNGTQAVLTIDGPVTANQTHQAVRITADNQQVQYQQLTGYNGSVTNQQTYPNSRSAFVNFLYAIGRAGFLHGDTSAALSDERGYCPLGDRYIFQLIDPNGNNIERFWATSCGGTKTYDGNVFLTVQLFQAQVPNYNNLTSSLQL